QPAPEGAWGTTVSRGIVSKESLEEAGAIPERRQPITVRQWIARGFVAAAGITLLVGGTLFALSWLGSKKQEKLVNKALDAFKGKTSPEAGIINLSVGRYHLNRNEPDAVGSEKNGAKLDFEQ